MMYNDKVGYGPTVRDALTELFGPGADATATGPAPTGPVNGQAPAATPPGGESPSGQPPANQGTPPTQAPTAVPPGAPVQLSPAKAAALQDINTALDALQGAQSGGNFAEFGEALQRLDDAVKKYQSAR
jgi:uncharacterized membrane protein (UPF0182 family)